MKKLILSILFVLCLSFQASAWNPMVVVSGGGGGGEAADPCSSPVGTYEWVWTGEHATGSDYACLNSGTSTDQGTDDAGTITGGSLISGTYEITLDNDNEEIIWGTMPTNLVTLSDNNGYIRFKLTTPADITHTADQELMRFWYNGDDKIDINIPANQDVVLVARVGSTADDLVQIAIAANKTYEILYTWDVDNNEHTVLACDDGDCSVAEIATCGANCDNDGETLAVSATNYDEIQIGYTTWTNDFTYYIDDVIIGVGYIGP